MSIPPLSFIASPPLPPSIPLNQRKDKTYGDDKHKACLVTWLLSHKRAMNTLVKSNNKNRLDKHAEPGCSAASYLVSLLTTEGLQYISTLSTFLKHSSTMFLQALAKITLKSKELLGFLRLKNKWLRDAVDNSPEDITKKHKKIFNCSKEVESQPSSFFQFEGYYAELYCLANAKWYIPLHLFTLTNIAIVYQEGDTLSMKKIQNHGHGKVMVLNISKARFEKETNLMELQWQDTSPCYVNFLSSL
ncbi:uncharacterized protein ARMOST_04649 [Armillaria ostoyae]|uniref:Uncharacterized protein n=1 Tax=Armillaria ostoyae TaxID=47428 RepID=A0A284QXY1_ARMOS|nr:uncharacterized protein ARMOST_04649 [Armillaria ostoyae]